MSCPPAFQLSLTNSYYCSKYANINAEKFLIKFLYNHTSSLACWAPLPAQIGK